MYWLPCSEARSGRTEDSEVGWSSVGGFSCGYSGGNDAQEGGQEVMKHGRCRWFFVSRLDIAGTRENGISYSEAEVQSACGVYGEKSRGDMADVEHSQSEQGTERRSDSRLGGAAKREEYPYPLWASFREITLAYGTSCNRKKLAGSA